MPIDAQSDNHNEIFTIDAGDIDRVMLLAIWVKYLEEFQKQKILFAGMGNPSFPISNHIVSAELLYWIGVLKKAQAADDLVNEMNSARAPIDERYHIDLRDKVVALGPTVPYANPSGNINARELDAQALNKWYPGLKAVGKDILLPVGGSSALYSIFHFINKYKNPKGVIVTPFPYYSLYKGHERQNNLHPIHVMKQPGYKLTIAALQESLQAADKKNILINAYLFCDPNNPLGTVTDKEEWIKIANVLRERLKHEKDFLPENKTPIILDEAYAEMGLFKTPISFLTILIEYAPELVENVILMRSATKGLSAAGERMALLYSANQGFIKKCLPAGLNIYGHMPTSAHGSFAAGLNGLSQHQLEKMANYYKPQLELVYQRACAMSITMPDDRYKPEGTFYILLDLHELMGTPLNQSAKAAVGNKKFIETDEDICYHLLFEEGVMICPTSYFGLNVKKGFVRVTCSGGDTQLHIIMDKISEQVIRVRKDKNNDLRSRIKKEGDDLRKIIAAADNELIVAENLKADINKKLAAPIVEKNLKEENLELVQLLEKTQALIRNLNPEAQQAYDIKYKKALIDIQRVFRGHLGRGVVNALKATQAELQFYMNKAMELAAQSNIVSREGTITLSWDLKGQERKQTTVKIQTKTVTPLSLSVK